MNMVNQYSHVTLKDAFPNYSHITELVALKQSVLLFTCAVIMLHLDMPHL